jgi:DNA-binding GntR family transcriptional regulator
MSIAEFVKQDLRARLLSGQQPPADLKLEALAEHYEVSFTPVRTAIAELVAEGVLLKGSNRRLLPGPPQNGTNGSAIPLAPHPRPEPPRDLLKVIERDLVNESIKGEAIFLREEAAAKRYGVSRSVIRSTFSRLAGTGLLRHIRRRGWQLRPFRQEDMQSFNEIREVLELKALELAEQRLVPEQIQRILDGNAFPASEADAPRIDNSLHLYIIEQAGNPYITDFFERQGRYYEILFDWEDLDRDAAIETVRQHRQILEAILRQDWQTAKSALSWHIRWNHPILGKVVSDAHSLE